MAKEVVQQRGLAIRVACAVFSISESCYRYEPKQAAENALIADWLIQSNFWGSVQIRGDSWSGTVSWCWPPWRPYSQAR